uniref:Solute carrier family 9 member C1 n=1 Tax=Otolemur garnettii TaxID=30611 RepID=H0WFR9_OTOGA
WLKVLRSLFLSTPENLPEMILILSLICTLGAFLNLHLKDFPIPLPVILFLVGCSLEILSFTSFQVQRYAEVIQEISPRLFFGIFTPIIFFNVAFDMDVYILQKLCFQILLLTIPGFFINYILILWYLASVNKLLLKPGPWLLFSAILVSSDPMLTAAAIRDLGLSRSLTSLINGESLMTSVMSLIVFGSVMNISNTTESRMNHTLTYSVMHGIWSYFMASFLFGILSAKLIQLWMSTVFGDDVNHISLILSVLYLTFYICELVGMSGIFTLATMGLLLNSASFKPGVESLLLEFWNWLSFVAFLMVFTFTGLLIPARTYLFINFSDVYYSLNIYFTLIVLRLLVFLLMSPVLSRVGHGFSWRWAFIMVWSEMKGTPNINMALLFAYSDIALVSEREKSQILFHGVSVCLINLIVNKFILPMAVTKLGLRDVTSTKYKSVYYTFQHFQELTKSFAAALKFDKDLANADWNMVEKAIILQNPYALNQEETTEHQKVTCPNCNKQIDETLNIEALELANRRLLSAQIASYQRQYRNDTLSQGAVQVLVGAAGSFGEKKGEYVSLETIKKYSEGKKLLSVVRKLLLDWVYNTRKDKGIPSKHFIFRVCHQIVFTDEFEYVGYLIILMNTFPIVISWVPDINETYEDELIHANYSFLTFYILENLLKVVKNLHIFFFLTGTGFEPATSDIKMLNDGIVCLQTDGIVVLYQLTRGFIELKETKAFRIRVSDSIRVKVMSPLKSFNIHHSVKEMGLLKLYQKKMKHLERLNDDLSRTSQGQDLKFKLVENSIKFFIRKISYLEYDHPDITVTMKTKEESNVMLNMAKEIIKVFRSKGIIYKIEGTEIIELIMARKRQVLDFQPVIKPLTVEEALYHIPWLDKDSDHMDFIQERARVITYDCGNEIFKEDDEPKGIYIIISGMVKLKRSKPGLGIKEIPESEEKDYSIIYTEYVLNGEIIGEINCLTNECMKYSALCKTVVEICFIPKDHLYEAFKRFCPVIEHKMWLKLGLGITARKIRQHLSYEDWNYKMQLKLSNVFVRDIPKSTKTSIYDETVTYVILIHGAVEDCQLRKIYKAPFLIPITCHQIQGTENFTKVMIVQTPANMEKFRWGSRK